MLAYAQDINGLRVSAVKPKNRANMSAETEETVKLLHVVESCTGEKHLGELAYILYAAYEERGITRNITADSLSAMLSRARKRNKKLPA